MARADAAAGQRHQRRAGAVGRLDRARRADAVAEQRGMGIADHGVDRHAGRQGGRAGGDVAETARRRDAPRQHRQRHVEERARVRRPSASVSVSKSWVRDALRMIGGVDRAAGQVPEQPAVDGAGAQFTALRLGARARRVVEQPGDLGGREQRIERQARSGSTTARRGPPRAARSQRSARCGGTAR